MPTQLDALLAKRTVAYLEAHGCPEPQAGEGSTLFKQRSDGTWPNTPDIVAGPFKGEEHPETFFIDIVAPRGEYIVKEQAGAPITAGFWLEEMRTKPGIQRDLDAVPDDLATPLVGSVLRKAEKYAKPRSDSPLFGAIAYFNEESKSGPHIITMLSYMQMLQKALGGINLEVTGLLLADRRHSAIVTEVTWDHPIAFVMQLVEDGTGSNMRSIVLINQHERLRPCESHPVRHWLNGLGK